MLKKSQLPEVGPQGHRALTTSHLGWTQGCSSTSQLPAKALVDMGPALSQYSIPESAA